MREKTDSVRQLIWTALVAGLSPAAAMAGCGWQGLAAGLPVLAAAGGVLGHLLSRRRLNPGGAGSYIIKVSLAVYGVLLMSRVFSRCAARLSHTGGGGEEAAPWLILLTAGLLLWMGRSRAEVFFRTAAICRYGAVVMAAALLIWAAFHVEPSRLTLSGGGLGKGLAGGLEGASVYLFLIPYINKEGERGGALFAKGLPAYGVAALLLAAATVGVLGQETVALVKEPFFTMTAVLGRSVRVDGLVSALWLVPDVVCLGLLSLSWRREGRNAGRLQGCGILLAAAAGIFGLPNLLPEAFWGLAGAAMWGITAVVWVLLGEK